jgi:hypothetical protein
MLPWIGPAVPAGFGVGSGAAIAHLSVWPACVNVAVMVTTGLAQQVNVCDDAT